jgi:hypothetical protein
VVGGCRVLLSQEERKNRDDIVQCVSIHGVIVLLCYPRPPSLFRRLLNRNEAQFPIHRAYRGLTSINSSSNPLAIDA